MKHGSRIFILFCCFVSLFTCVEVIDRYSSAYEDCSHLWRAEIEASKRYPAQTEFVKKQLIADNMVAPDNQSCPGLWPGHKERLLSELNAIK